MIWAPEDCAFWSHHCSLFWENN